MKKIIFILSLIMVGCQAAPAPAPLPLAPAGAAPAAEAAPALLMRLRSLTADNACTRDEQCLTVPIGARACGGPEAFLAYSTAGGTRPEAVAALAQRFSAARAGAVAASGELSSCIAIADPGALCLADVCQLRTRSNDRR